MSVAVEFEALGALAKGWSWQPLQNLTDNPRRDIADGPFGSNLKASEYVDQGVPIARLQNVDRNQFIDKNIRCVTEHKAAGLIRHRFEPGDILLTKLGDPIGKACIVPPTAGSGVIVADLVRIRPSAGRVDLKYLAYALNSPAVIRQLERHTKGTTRPRVNLGVVRELPIPVAPRDQQESVVAEIEKQFSRLDEAVANLKRVKANLKRYKAAVLKTAVEGRLVTTEAELARREGRRYETGGQLLHRIVEARRLQWKGKYVGPIEPAPNDEFVLPEGWTRASVSQVMRERIVNGLSVKESPAPTDVRALRLSAMSDNGFDFEDFRYLPVDADEIEDIVICEGDFFASRGNGSLDLVGRGCRAQKSPHKVIFPDTMMRIRFTETASVGPWFQAIWSGRLVRQQIEALVKTTAGIYKIAQPQLASVTVPFPPLAEQHRIIPEIDRRLSLVREVEAEVDANLKRVQALRQATLSRAFNCRFPTR